MELEDPAFTPTEPQARTPAQLTGGGRIGTQIQLPSATLWSPAGFIPSKKLWGPQDPALCCRSAELEVQSSSWETALFSHPLFRRERGTLSPLLQAAFGTFPQALPILEICAEVSSLFYAKMFLFLRGLESFQGESASAHTQSVFSCMATGLPQTRPSFSTFACSHVRLVSHNSDVSQHPLSPCFQDLGELPQGLEPLNSEDLLTSPILSPSWDTDSLECL